MEAMRPTLIDSTNECEGFRRTELSRDRGKD